MASARTLSRSGKTEREYEDSLVNGTIHLLASTFIADTEPDGPTRHGLWTCPRGRLGIIDQVILRSNSASLAGMDDVDFGGGAVGLSPPWINGEAGIVDMITINDYMILRLDSNEAGVINGDSSTEINREFCMLVVSGSTVPSTLVVDVFGYMYNS